MAALILQLRERRAALLAEGEALGAKAQTAGGYADEDRTRDDEIVAALATVDADIAREERRIERIKLAPVATEDRPQVSGVHDRAADKPWASFGEFLTAVAQYGTPGGAVDPRLFRAEVSGASSGVATDGGVFVGTDYSRMLLDRSVESSMLAPLCRSVEIGANSDGLEAPYIDETSRATGSRWGGVQVYRRAEADTVTATKPTFAKFDLRLEDLMGLAYATERLLQDATALESVFTDAFTSEFAWKLDNEILRGTGNGECLGILNANNGSLITVNKESGQQAASIVAENIIKMRARLHPRSRAKAVWLVNTDIESELSTMAISVGTGGSLVYMPAGGLSTDGYDRLYARPVVPVEQASTLGTVGDITLADLSQYVLIRKGGIQSDQSMHVRFIYNERTFRWVYRVNGAPTWRTTLTPANGTSTLSPFVTLQTRS